MQQNVGDPHRLAVLPDEADIGLRTQAVFSFKPKIYLLNSEAENWTRAAKNHEQRYV